MTIARDALDVTIQGTLTQDTPPSDLFRRVQYVAHTDSKPGGQHSTEMPSCYGAFTLTETEINSETN